MAIDALLLAYVSRSSRVRATFAADPRSAPTMRAVLWSSLRGLLDLSRWPAAVKRAWTGEASLAGALIAFALLALGLFLAASLGTFAGYGLIGAALLILALGLIAVWAWRAAERIRREHRFGVLALALAALPVVASVALLTNVYFGTPRGSHASVQGDVLRIVGGIDGELPSAVARLLAANPQVVRVELTSGGGYMAAGARVGEMIRRRGLATRSVQICASACTVIFVAGRERELASGARLGFHTPQALGFGRNWDSVEPFLERLRQLGAGERFMRRVQDTPPEDMWWPTVAELLENGILSRNDEAGMGVERPPSRSDEL